VQARDPALEHDEARARDPCRRLEVHEPELLADRHVIERREVELARSAPAAYLGVGGFVAPVGHAVVQSVRQPHDEFVELGRRRRLLLLEAR